MIQWLLLRSQSCAAFTTIWFQNTPITPKETPVPIQRSLPASPILAPHPSPPQVLENTNLRPVSVAVPVPDISREWSHMAGGLLCLASFTQNNVFEFRPCRSVSVPQPFYWTDCIHRPHFISPFSRRWTFGFHFLTIVRSAL